MARRLCSAPEAQRATPRLAPPSSFPAKTTGNLCCWYNLERYPAQDHRGDLEAKLSEERGGEEGANLIMFMTLMA